VSDAQQTGDATRQRSREFLDRMAERLGAQATVGAVFGEPIDRGEVTIVPVARVRLQVGAGRGRRGGFRTGGGISASPVGYLEIGDGGARFRSIPDLPAIARLVVANGFATCMILCAVGHVCRSGAGTAGTVITGSTICRAETLGGERPPGVKRAGTKG
jgi:hypothetical protein